MKQENKENIYRNIRRGLYVQVAEGENKSRIRLILASLTILLVASALLFTATLIETGRTNQYSYFFGETEQKVNEELVFIGTEQMIDMNALATYLNLEKSSLFSEMSFKSGITQTSFTDGSNVAVVNGNDFVMSTGAVIKNGYCMIPISAAKSLINGLTIEVSDNKTTVTHDGRSVYMITTNPDVTYVTDVSAYMPYIKSKNAYIYVLANKQNPIGKDFVPDNLTEIPEKYRKSEPIYLNFIAEQALEAMMQDMLYLGFDDVYVTSAYRKYSYQEWLFNYYIEQEMKSGITREEAIEIVLTYSSEPGKSEHQTGLCVDFTTKSINGVVDDAFATTEVFAWLRDNAWKYGFVLRYPEDKVAITGYSYESWHYRFVGLEVASIMHQTGLCYEEYLEAYNTGENK